MKRVTSLLIVAMLLAPSPAAPQTASPSPAASPTPIPFFSTRSNAGPQHNYSFWFPDSRDTKMEFSVIAQILYWPTDIKHTVTYHVEVNGRPLPTRTVDVEASNEFPIAETFNVVSGKFTTQIVIESPVSQRGTLISNTLTCRPAAGSQGGSITCVFER